MLTTTPYAHVRVVPAIEEEISSNINMMLLFSFWSQFIYNYNFIPTPAPDAHWQMWPRECFPHTWTSPPAGNQWKRFCQWESEPSPQKENKFAHPPLLLDRPISRKYIQYGSYHIVYRTLPKKNLEQFNGRTSITLNQLKNTHNINLINITRV